MTDEHAKLKANQNWEEEFWYKRFVNCDYYKSIVKMIQEGLYI